MKIDPQTKWPFFVHHGTRRTTWEDPRYTYDPRYSGSYDPRSGSMLGRGFSDNSNQGGVTTPISYPEMPLQNHANKHLDNLSDNIVAGGSHPRSVTSIGPRQISQQKNVSKVAMVKDSPSTQHVQLDYNSSSGQCMPINSNVVINPEVTVEQNSKTLLNTSECDIQMQIIAPVHSSTVDSIVTNPGIVSGFVGVLPSTNVKDFSQPQVFSNTSSPELNRISEIAQKSLDLEQKVLSFNGPHGSKEYVIIEESLMSLLLLLDKIEAHGDADVRQARKLTVCRIQQLLSNLEEKAKKY